MHFFVRVFPEAVKASDGPCRFSDDQLRQNSIVLFAYFSCFAVVRICVFFPGVAARVAEIQLGYQGIWRQYALHMILHGPLYIFGIGSVLFGFQLMMSPKCEGDPGDDTPELHLKLGWYASLSCTVFAFCLILAFFHARLIGQAAVADEEEKRRAPKGTLEKLLAYTYKDHRELFGDEEGKLYPGECPICLSEWEDDDIISITPCGHSFHKECIGHWIESERTCAFCRQDVVLCPGRSTSRGTLPSPVGNRSLVLSVAVSPDEESSNMEIPVAVEGEDVLLEAQVIGRESTDFYATDFYEGEERRVGPLDEEHQVEEELRLASMHQTTPVTEVTSVHQTTTRMEFTI
jgi:hypothetical protein